MSALSLLMDLAERGCRVTAEGDALRVVPTSLLTDADRAAIRAAKPAIVELLAAGALALDDPACVGSPAWRAAAAPLVDAVHALDGWLDLSSSPNEDGADTLLVVGFNWRASPPERRAAALAIAADRWRVVEFLRWQLGIRLDGGPAGIETCTVDLAITPPTPAERIGRHGTYQMATTAAGDAVDEDAPAMDEGDQDE
ncbi:MAG: hypothetical protein U0556_10055 [Dehalococcoidia bacterium]